MSLKDNLVAYWDFDRDPRFSSIVDRSGNGNRLTPNGSPITGAGIVGNGVELDGRTQWLSMDSMPGISHQGNPFTVGLWFRPALLVDGAILCTCTEFGASTIISSGNYYASITVQDKDITLTDVPLIAGEWHFLAFGWYTNNGSFVWATINLCDRARVLKSSLTPQPSDPFRVGGTQAIGWFNGIIDEFVIWRRVVSATELRQVFNKGKGLPFSKWDAASPCKTIECCQ